MLPLDLLMLAALIGSILLGFPVSFSIAGTAIAFAFLGWITGTFDLSLLGALGQRAFGLLTNDVLIAIPLFVMMGVVLEKSRIAEELLETMGRLFGSLHGGLGVSVVLVGGLLAASTGIVGATVMAMGLIALPTMLRSGYNPAFASGIVCTAGTLGQIIPPSTLLIILSDVMSNAHQQAQFKQGKFTVETISVGQIFAGALFPGLLLVAIYIAYVLGRAFLIPSNAPPIQQDVPRPGGSEIIRAVLPPIILIIAVLGAILGGIATPTESASVGAIGAILMGGTRQGLPARIAVAAACVPSASCNRGRTGACAPSAQRRHNDRMDTGRGLYRLGAGRYRSGPGRAQTAQFRRPFEAGDDVNDDRYRHDLRDDSDRQHFLTRARRSGRSGTYRGDPHGDAGWSSWRAGLFNGADLRPRFFLDFVEITVILLPLIAPALILMGHDPYWLAILIAINLQTSFLTPPFGFSLFYLRGAAPKEVATGQIYSGVAPFIVLQVAGILMIWLIPSIATWLPATIF